MHFVLLTWYCFFILLASIVGGMIPSWVHLTHRRMELAVSFVAGVMLGVALLHMLPHALADATAGKNSAGEETARMAIMLWLLVGFLAMFFIERFFCYHHHEIPDEAHGAINDPHAHPHCEHDHDITWSGAAFGLSLHSILEGVAIAASVAHGGHDGRLAGLGVFLIILLHKPLDSMTITMLMARGGWSPTWLHVVNALFAMAIPLGAIMFLSATSVTVQFGDAQSHSPVLANALAFSAGLFLCIAMSDLLPELQFHQHDRLSLSAALLLGLAIAYGLHRLELTTAHTHSSGAPQTQDASSE